MSKITIPTYSLGEEIVNAISHGIGAALAIAAIPLMCVHAHSAIGVVSSVIYCVIMIVLYTISCIYHALSPRVKGKKVLRVIDHCNVQLMIAGTYTPVCLSLFGGFMGWTLFGFVWTLTVISVVLNAIDLERFKKLVMFLIMLIGWCAIVIVKPLYLAVGTGGMILLVGGGVIYTIGAVLYGIGSKKKWFHSIFHFFVLAASILHFFFLYFYVI